MWVTRRCPSTQLCSEPICVRRSSRFWAELCLNQLECFFYLFFFFTFFSLTLNQCLLIVSPEPTNEGKEEHTR